MQDLLAGCRDPVERNRLAQEHLGRTLRCATGRPSNFPRFVKFVDEDKTLSKDACRRYIKRGQSKVCLRTGEFYEGHASCWDDDSAASEQFRHRLRENGVGRVLMYKDGDRVIYPEEVYLRRTHWGHDLE